MSIFGRGRIETNKKAAQHTRNLYKDMVEQTIEQHSIIHWGLFFSLKKFDDNAQEFLDNCNEYPKILRLGNVVEMERVFKILHERICDVVFENEHHSECECSDGVQAGLTGFSICGHCEGEGLSENADLVF